MFYTQAGGVDLLKAKWRKLSDFLSVECDGVDITPRLRQHKVHSVLFLNVPCFGSGTRSDPSHNSYLTLILINTGHGTQPRASRGWMMA